VAQEPRHAARILRLAVIGWGLGHIALGLRRGWLLLALQPAAIAFAAVVVAALLDGTRWLVVFPPLLVLFLVWIGQALDAHRRALRAGYAPGGEWAIAAVLPVMLLVLTAFWVLGGRYSSPSATLQAYTDAWIRDRPDAASALFVAPRAPEDMDRLWEEERRNVVERISRARALYGRDSGLDPERPFDSLRFRQQTASDGRVAMIGEIVRNERVETTLLGFIPTASQQTVVVEPGVTVWLQLQPQPLPEWLEGLPMESQAWKIVAVEEPAGT
jgi:hypothetical protein